MSGIVGLWHLDGEPVDRALLRTLTDSMTFRGPDAQEIWSDGAIGFGHAMLRTTDESQREQQPATRDRTTWITADARIDARSELVRELTAHSPRKLDACPDVELILEAYHAWGERCVDHLIGDFAFAIWDLSLGRLFCARDQLGVKPFMYARVGSRFIFSNTLDCLRGHPAVSGRINDKAIADFLLFECLQDQSASFFSDIQRLPAAHTLTVSAGETTIQRYWSLPVEKRIRYRHQEEYVEHFTEVLGTAVADRLRTDRAVIFMSGGCDSSAVACAVKQHPNPRVNGCDVHAQTRVYDRLIPDQERHYAGLVASCLKMPIDYFECDDYVLFDHWDDKCRHTPEPEHGSTPALEFDSYERASAHARVALTGIGGDSLFSYETDVADLLRKGRPDRIAGDLIQSLVMHRRLPPIGIRTNIRRLIQGRPVPQIVKPPEWMEPHFARRMGLCDGVPSRSEVFQPEHAVRARAQQSLLYYKWPFRFESQDPGVIRVPLESRHPYFDLRVIDYVLAIPPIPWSINKELLRTDIGATLPREVRRRPKTVLAGDPESIQSRDPAVHKRLFSFRPTLSSHYIAAGAFPPALEGSPEEFYRNLRPLNLEYWFRWATGISISPG